MLPGFDPVCHLPEGEPLAWLDWLRAEGYDVPEDWRRSSTDPPRARRGARSTTPSTRRTAFLTDRFLDVGAARATEPWFVHLSYLRPHPPFLAPAPYDTMFDPASVPAPVRAPTRAEEGAQHPLLGVMIDHPFLKSPDDPTSNASCKRRTTG